MQELLIASLGGHPSSIIIRVTGILPCHLRASRAIDRASAVSIVEALLLDCSISIPHVWAEVIRCSRDNS
jgi:hypothetical protein